MNFRAASRTFSPLIAVSLFTGACNNMLGPDKAEIPTAIPPYVAPVNVTTEYRCSGGKKLYVRFKEDGSQAWVVLPDREWVLNRIPSQISSRYINGTAILDAKGLDATFSNGAGVAYTACKIPN